MQRLMMIGLSVALVSGAAMAQVNGRRENQQDRIAQGVQSGSLTAGETSNLEKKEAAVNQEIRADKSLNGGKLTAGEQRVVNGQQNNLSRQIYNDKHNAVTQQYGKNEVDARRENQQDRIAQGIRSGSLNAGQTARLEGSERRINQEVHSDRAANGGKLTAGERAQVNGQQNKLSGRIYRAKH